MRRVTNTTKVAFVTEHPWVDDETSNPHSTTLESFLTREKQGAKYVAAKQSRRKYKKNQTSKLPRIQVVTNRTKPETKTRSREKRWTPVRADSMRHSKRTISSMDSKTQSPKRVTCVDTVVTSPLSRTLTRQRLALRPSDKHATPFPARLMYKDYFATIPVDEIDTLGWRISATEMKRFARTLPCVKRFRVRGVEHLTDEMLEHISRCDRIEQLVLENCPKITTSGIDSLRRTLCRIRHITLSACDGVDDRGYGLIVRSLRKLESLTIRGSPRLTDLGMKDMGSRPRKYDAVRRLVLEDCPLVTDKGMLALLRGFGGLREISLISLPRVSDLGLMGLVSAIGKPVCQDLSRFSAVDLPGLTDSGVSWIASGCPKLQYLNLAKCTDVRDRALVALSEKCLELRELVLEDCTGITDNGLSALRTCTSLEVINLNRCCNVSERGIASIVKSCLKLACWSLIGVNQLTDEGIRSMYVNRTAMKELRLTSGETTGVGKGAYFGKPRLSDLSFCELMTGATNLRILHVSGFSRITDVTIRQVAANCTLLEELHISGCLNVTDKSLVPLLRQCTHLTSLRANRCVGLTDTTMTSLTSPHGLNCLHVGFCKHITDRGVEHVARSCPRLAALNLKYCNELTVRSIVTISTYCRRSLVSLNVSGVEAVTSEMMFFFTKRCRLIKSLNVRNTSILSRTTLRPCEKYLPMARVHDQGVQLAARRNARAIRVRFDWDQRRKREMESALIVQRAYRAHLAHKASVAYLIAQAEAKRAAEDAVAQQKARELKRMNDAATRISTIVRGYVSRRRFQRLRRVKVNAAREIQRRFRGRLGWYKALRRREEIIAEEREKMRLKMIAAVNVQRRWRGYSGRVNCRLLIGIRTFEERVRRAAAVTIQCAYRSSRSRRTRVRKTRARDEQRERERASATILANCWRRFVSRDIAAQLREERNELWREAVTIIQSHARGHLARNRYLVMRERSLRAVALLQRAWRTRVAKKIVSAMRAAKRAFEALLEEKAVVVQNAWRTRLARKIVSAAKYATWEKKRRRFASIRIQTTFRRHSAQRLLQSKRKIQWQRKRELARRTREGRARTKLLEDGAAEKIQRLYRSIIDRRYLRTQIRWRRKEAAINIARIVRGFLTRQFTSVWREEVLWAATKIQSLYRIRQARIAFFNIVRAKRLEQENLRKDLKRELIEKMRQKQERLAQEILRNNAAMLIQSGAKEWMKHIHRRRAEDLIAKKQEARRRQKELMENRSFFAKMFGKRAVVDEGDDDDGSANKSKSKRRRKRRLPKIRIGRMMRKARANAMALVSKKARMRMQQDKMSGLAYSVLSSQKHLFNLDAVIDMHITIGQDEREAFQIEQDRSKARKLPYFTMIEPDFSFRPPDTPLDAHLWFKKEPGATNLVSSVEIVGKPVTKTNREFKAILKAWKDDGITTVMHKQLPFVLHLRRGGKEPITDMKISTRHIDEENLDIAGYTRIDDDLLMWTYGEDVPSAKPYYLWVKIMNIVRSQEQNRIAGVMKHQPYYNQRLQHMMDYLSLTEDEVYTLHDLFVEIDVDKGGTIDVDELFDYLEEPKTGIAEGFFNWIDRDSSGELDFSEYVHMLGTVCMMGSADMFQIAFSIVDTDGSGFVDEKEIEGMLEMFECSTRVRQTLMSKVRKLTSRHRDNYVKINEFRTICDQFPSVLFPIQRLQDKLMSVSMGTRWWNKKRADFAKARDFLKKQSELARLA